MSDNAGMIIVGAGECGYRAALELRENGYAGPVTLIGAENALPYERPPLSKAVLLADEEPSPTAVTTAEKLAEAGIGFCAATAVLSLGLASKTVLTDRHEVLHYDKLLLATGARPRGVAVDGSADRFVTLRTFEDALAIRNRLGTGSRIAILGGGFIGLEVAASARQKGCDVTVVEVQNRILMRGVPEAIARRIHDLHVANGVSIVCGTGISGLGGGGEIARIVLADGRVISADLVVVGIGAQPNVAIAEAAGLDVNNGIVVDAMLRTSDPDVFAAGDCCQFPLALYGNRRVRLESWRNAVEQGGEAARSMLGLHEAEPKLPWFWSDQYDYGLQIAGLSDEGPQTVTRLLGQDGILQFHLTAEGRIMAASAFGPGNSVAKDIKIIERAILAGVVADTGQLADPAFRLKSLLGS